MQITAVKLFIELSQTGNEEKNTFKASSKALFGFFSLILSTNNAARLQPIQ
jgi:hypothetical protein